MTADDLLPDLLALKACSGPAEWAGYAATYPVAVEIVDLVADGFVTAAGVTADGAAHLYDLWADYGHA